MLCHGVLCFPLLRVGVLIQEGSGFGHYRCPRRSCESGEYMPCLGFDMISVLGAEGAWLLLRADYVDAMNGDRLAVAS